MDDPSSIVVKDDHGIEQPECRGRDHEHVDRGHGCHMVPQKGAPSRGGGSRAARQISAHRGLAHVDAELEQFAVDMRRAQSGLSRPIRRIRSRVSLLVLGHPGQRDRHRQ